jgi:Domain of unknown function (DUF222)
MHTENLCAAIANLKDATSLLLNLDLANLTDPALLDAVRQLRPVVCQVQAAQARLIGAVHVRGAVTAEGAVSTAAWLRNGIRMDDTAARVRSAMVLDRLPQVAAAFAAGDISEAHVDVIAKVARDIPDEAMAAGAEKLLVEQAMDLAPTKFVQAATKIRDHLDPDAAERRRRRRLTERSLYANRTFEGAVSVNGMFDPEAGETLLTALAALMPPPRAGDLRSTPTRRADALLDLCRLAANTSPIAGGEKPHVIVTVDLDTLRSKLSQTSPNRSTPSESEVDHPGQGQPPPPQDQHLPHQSGDEHSAERRLTASGQRTATAESNGSGPPPAGKGGVPADPNRNDESTAQREEATTPEPNGSEEWTVRSGGSATTKGSGRSAPGAAPERGRGYLAPFGEQTGWGLGEPCGPAGWGLPHSSPIGVMGQGATLGSGWPIGPETARRLACDAGIIPLLIGSHSEPLDVGRLSRSAPPALRRALVYRDGGCRFPQCDRPPEWTDAHHVRH